MATLDYSLVDVYVLLTDVQHNHLSGKSKVKDCKWISEVKIVKNI